MKALNRILRIALASTLVLSQGAWFPALAASGKHQAVIAIGADELKSEYGAGGSGGGTDSTPTPSPKPIGSPIWAWSTDSEFVSRINIETTDDSNYSNFTGAPVSYTLTQTTENWSQWQVSAGFEASGPAKALGITAKINGGYESGTKTTQTTTTVLTLGTGFRYSWWVVRYTDVTGRYYAQFQNYSDLTLKKIDGTQGYIIRYSRFSSKRSNRCNINNVCTGDSR